MKRLSITYFILLIILSLNACTIAPPLYFAKGVNAQVVDEAGKSLEKVIVVAMWTAGGVGIGDTGHSHRLRVYETITDKRGNFTIPSELVLRNPFSRLPGISLHVFKRGYLASGFYLNDKQPFKLKQITSDMSIMYQADELSRVFDPITNDDPQDWKNYPRMLLAVDAEKKHLKEQGLEPGYGPSVPNISRFSNADKQFLEEFIND